MNIILKLVSTNSGWIARRLIMYVAVVTAAIATWLNAKGFSTETSQFMSAAATSFLFGCIELVLSWIARKYKVAEADGLKMDITNLRGKAPLIAAVLLCLLCVPSCVGGRFLGLDGGQWGDVGRVAGMGALKGGAEAGLSEWGKQRASALEVTATK